MLAFENVSLTKDKNEILKDLSFQIHPGEKIGIIGESGAGKSSIFKLLIGEERSTSGKIILDTITLSEIAPRDIQKYRRQIGIVFQDFRLLSQKTVFENVAFALEVCGKETEINEKVPILLQMVGLSGKEFQFPHSLSGGERQRLAIARALIHNPPILIADEPTGNLDPRNAKEIGELFVKLNKEKGLTIICATHDPRFIDILSPRIIKIQKGHITFDKKNCTTREAFSEIL